MDRRATLSNASRNHVTMSRDSFRASIADVDYAAG
jgi:hypothetical protein